MAGTVTLKDFLIRLGFRVDQSQERNFNESMQKTAKGALEVTKAFAKIAGATVAGMSASGFALKKMSDGLAGLYYSAQRTGSSVKELKVLQYGFEQVGLSAEDAQSSVEALAAARRNIPGLDAQLVGLGVKPQLDNAKVLVDLLGKLRGMQPFMQAKYASMFGLNAGVINQLELNGPTLLAAMKRREEMFRKEGYNPDVAAKKAVEFERAWNDAKARYSDMAQEMAVKLLPLAERFITVLEKTADWLIKADNATSGWVLRIGALGTALLPILGALKLSGGLGLMGGLFGGGAGAAGAAGAGAAGAAAGGIGLGTVAIPVVVLSALGALIWLLGHPDQLKEQVDQAHKFGDFLRGTLADAWAWTKDKLKDQVKDVHETGDGLKVTAASFGKGLMGDLAGMVGKFEGFSKKIYADAGHLSWGFGHQIKPGEDVTGKDPLAVFNQDLTASLAAVAKYVHVKLSDNQRKALASLEYNIGEGSFRNSTLLRKLNAGDSAGAADQFGVWKYANKHVSDALVARRATEASMFRIPDGKQVTINAPTTINVDGSGSPKETAREIGRQQNRKYGDLVRNFGGAYQ